MAEPIIPQLRVKALQPKRHRAGLEFTSAPSDLTVEMLGFGIAAIMALAAILADPLLSVTVVEGETERAITDEERDALTALIEDESARAQPDDPPTADAAEQTETDRPAAETVNTSSKPSGRKAKA